MTLFAVAPVDLDALQVIAARSIPRPQLVADGWRNLVKSRDLFAHGYSVSHWLHPRRPGEEVLEFVPRGAAGAGLPRVTADSYRARVEVHDALGLRVVSPGAEFMPLDASKQGRRTCEMNTEIRLVRQELAKAEQRVVELRRLLDAMLVEAGRRPTSGEDQPRLFEVEVEAQGRLF